MGPELAFFSFSFKCCSSTSLSKSRTLRPCIFSECQRQEIRIISRLSLLYVIFVVTVNIGVWHLFAFKMCLTKHQQHTRPKLYIQLYLMIFVFAIIPRLIIWKVDFLRNQKKKVCGWVSRFALHNIVTYVGGSHSNSLSLLSSVW